MKQCLTLLLLLCLLPMGASAMEGAYLSGEELKAIEPSYEAFLNELADVLVMHGILSEAGREDWLMYQLGDFLQNGGFGSIEIDYAPGTAGAADEAVSMRRFSLETKAGLLVIETLRRYSEHYSPLPGIPLDAELLDDGGAAIPCRFRWVAPEGHFMFWDGTKEEVIDVGATYTSDGRPLYWYAEAEVAPYVTLGLEILPENSDDAMASVTFTVRADGQAWLPEVLQ